MAEEKTYKHVLNIVQNTFLLNICKPEESALNQFLSTNQASEVTKEVKGYFDLIMKCLWRTATEQGKPVFLVL